MRALDPQSESEAEVVEDPCEAVLVGLEHGANPGPSLLNMEANPGPSLLIRARTRLQEEACGCWSMTGNSQTSKGKPAYTFATTTNFMWPHAPAGNTVFCPITK